jgi:hypothetical protein
VVGVRLQTRHFQIDPNESARVAFVHD